MINMLMITVFNCGNENNSDAEFFDLLKLQ
jgi:hypothetical protein